MSNNRLMIEYKQKFEEIIDDLKFVLNQSGYTLTDIRTDPPLTKSAVNMLKEKGVDVNV